MNHNYYHIFYLIMNEILKVFYKGSSGTLNPFERLKLEGTPAKEKKNLKWERSWHSFLPQETYLLIHQSWANYSCSSSWEQGSEQITQPMLKEGQHWPCILPVQCCMRRRSLGRSCLRMSCKCISAKYKFPLFSH